MPELTASLMPKSLNTANFTPTVTHMEKKSPFLILNTLRTEYKSCFSALRSNCYGNPHIALKYLKRKKFPATNKISNTNIVTGI